MSTKKDASMETLMIARAIHDRLAGDDEADSWVQWLLSLARSLNPTIGNGPESDIYIRLLASGRVSIRVKLRRLIDHPNTPQPEREAALSALERLP